jgi:hypothetical protein
MPFSNDLLYQIIQNTYVFQSSYLTLYFSNAALCFWKKKKIYTVYIKLLYHLKNLQISSWDCNSIEHCAKDFTTNSHFSCIDVAT